VEERHGDRHDREDDHRPVRVMVRPVEERALHGQAGDDHGAAPDEQGRHPPFPVPAAQPKGHEGRHTQGNRDHRVAGVELGGEPLEVAPKPVGERRAGLDDALKLAAIAKNPTEMAIQATPAIRLTGDASSRK
jgi:hypothetical protein